MKNVEKKRRSIPEANLATLGDYFKRRQERGNSDLPTMSVTLNNGLVERSSLGRKTDTTLTAGKHLLVRQGDIAYNMMRMWQGASGMATHDGMVSPAYIVLAPKQNVLPLYASYWFKSPHMIHLFWAYSYGLTKDRLRLYFKDFSQIPVTLPPLEAQKKIAPIFVTLDHILSKTDELIELKRKMKVGLMQQLLSNGRKGAVSISRPKTTDSPTGWEYHALGKLGATYPGLSGKKKSEFGSGTPYIPYLNIFANSRINPNVLDRVQVSPEEKQHAVRYGDIFFTGSSETADEVGMSSVLLDDIGLTYLNSFCFGFRLASFELLLPEYARHLFRGPEFRKAIYCLAQGATRHNLSKTELMKVRILLPPISEQRQIAKTIDLVETDISNLENHRARFLEQKRGFMQKLFTFQRSEI